MPATSTPSREARPATAPSIASRWSPWESSVPPRRPPVPLDDEAVVGRLDLAAERRERVDHRRDPVGLLVPQLRGVADRRRALGEAGGERDQGQLVDRQRDLGAADRGGREPEAGASADRLAAAPRRLGSTSISAPIRWRIAQQADAGRVEADASSRPRCRARAARRRGGRRRRRSRRGRRSGPARAARRAGSTTASPSRRASAPAAASMRSVWSRVGSGSITRVSPSASRPAKSRQDLTWALATGRRTRCRAAARR